MNMNAYDFDRTIYKKDSSVEIYVFLLKKKPTLAFLCLPVQIVAWVGYFLKLLTKEEMKARYFCFLKHVDVEGFLDEFVDREIGKIGQWYLERRNAGDVIISASPRFLVERFAERLGVEHVIASEVDKHSGAFLSKNCHGEEKVRRFYEEFPAGKVEEFYSDSLSDAPMARIAQKAFLVKGEEVVEWEKEG